MVLYNDDTGSGVPVYYDANSRTWRKRVLTRDNCGKNAQLTPEELDKVLTVDGTYGTAIAVNNQMPGPPIIVYKDTEVVVNVANKLLLEGITLHWHGITQKKTSWMDGVGMVSQCPINPGETFQYRFIADKVGTHWYHSHYGTQRTDGLYGAFIVLDVDDDDASSIISDTGNPTKRNSPEEENVNKENRMVS
uniref:L-ascorbate oxidase-like n=1 Tax=Saccoglossus kowalevskii TaxID=10224 RepID=A0ABM0LWV7_SACKO|nr:PREDICTED: L-ascorbate oxidase-like [Saccoglossus kowalevskii]